MTESPSTTPHSAMHAFEATPSLEAELARLRRQAKQRFIGAAVLVLLAVITLPFLLDSQPRPVSSNVRIDIPKIGTQNMAPVPAESASSAAPAAPLVFAPPAALLPAASPVTPKEVLNKEVSKTDDGAKARALLEGDETHTKSKYIVQAGSFGDADKLQAVKHQLDKAGIKYHTQTGLAKDGTTRTRIRLNGSFASKAEANSAAAKVSKLGLAVIVLKP